MLPDISKIRARLGYEPHYTPEQTLERAVDWMKNSL
jgi:nucleoside-diphosphate-sugar epimerase